MKIEGRRLSLFCLNKENEREYLVSLKREVTDEGAIIIPEFSTSGNAAFTFESPEMASKYFKFLDENMDFEFFFCILPEIKEIISEEKKELDSKA